MRAVRLTRAGWWNDRVNGDAGAPLALDDAEAYEIVHVLRSAVYDPVLQAELDGTAVTLTSPEVPEVDPRAREVFEETLAEFPAAQPQDEAMQKLVDLTEELDLYDEPELKRPWTIAPKADWIAYALRGNHGQPRPTSEEAAQMTKAQLMNRYGERL